mmetsp:Transcript_11356/g.24237  ORF Transcript_11356/g.24237 Transcript_11356/m.24237 type:complete len:108 (-) Transcript_11356:132-455(-)
MVLLSLLKGPFLIRPLDLDAVSFPFDGIVAVVMGASKNDTILKECGFPSSESDVRWPEWRAGEEVDDGENAVVPELEARTAAVARARLFRRRRTIGLRHGNGLPKCC